MKFRISMKDPDGVYESAKEAAKKYQVDTEDILYELHPYFYLGEYVTIEVDTEKKTAVVVTSENI